MTCSIQIQAVLYHNDTEALIRSLDSISNAIKVEKKRTNRIARATVTYGDASQEPLFSNEQINKIVKAYKADIDFHYQYFNENTGFGKGHNLMGLGADADFLLIINPDAVLSPRFFISHLDPFFGESSDAGIVEGRQTPVEHPKEYDPVTGETDWSSGACMVVPSFIFQKLQGFDHETFFMYCEDVDFSWRVRLLGKKIIYQPLDPIFHPKQLTIEGRLVPTRTEKYCSAEANLLLAYKWSNEKWLKKLLSTYESSGEDHLIKAVESFRTRQKSNHLPLQIDKNHQASTFKPNGEYSFHRFGL